MSTQLLISPPPGLRRRPGGLRPEPRRNAHSWKTASGGSQPEGSFLSRLKAAPGLRFNAFLGETAEGRSDAENRLVAVVITATGHRSEFGYDGMGRRVEIRELDPDTTQTLQVTSDNKYLWDGAAIAEMRDATGGIVLQRYFSQGFVDSDGTPLYYTRDHLGSIRELTDGQQTIRARYDYDPWGRMTLLQGDRTSPFGFTGDFWHAQSGLDLTLFRAYDPNLGRWISRDPIEENGGINLYGYVANMPSVLRDPLGLLPPGLENDPESERNLTPLEGGGGSGLGGPTSSGLAPDFFPSDSPDPGTNTEPFSYPDPTYPNKCGKTENHHIWPKYLGGDPDGPIAPIDASYHQDITNAFRSLWPYGSTPPLPDVAQNIMNNVYSHYPLPPISLLK